MTIFAIDAVKILPVLNAAQVEAIGHESTSPEAVQVPKEQPVGTSDASVRVMVVVIEAGKFVLVGNVIASVSATAKLCLMIKLTA